MKYLIVAMMMMVLASNAHAEYKFKQIDQDVNTPTPKDLEGATITVTLPNGKSYKMSEKAFKVVPRKQQFKITDRIAEADCTPVAAAPVVVREVKEVRDLNIISLTLVRSIGDYDVSQQGSNVHVENKYEPAVGLMYQRNVYKHLYLGVQADTHRSLGGNIGLGF